MTRTRIRLLLFLSVATLLVASGLAFDSFRPTPIRAAYDRLKIGMTRKAVDAVFKDVRTEQFETHGPLVGFEWEGVVGGEVHKRHAFDWAALRGNPPPATSLSFHQLKAGCVEPEWTNWIYFRRPGSSEVAGKIKRFSVDETCQAIIDQDGSLIERSYYRYQRTPSWIRTVREYFAPLWPFQ